MSQVRALNDRREDVASTTTDVVTTINAIVDASPEELEAWTDLLDDMYKSWQNAPKPPGYTPPGS